MAGNAQGILGGTAVAVIIGFVSVLLGLIPIPGFQIDLGTRFILIILGAIAFWLGLHFSSA